MQYFFIILGVRPSGRKIIPHRSCFPIPPHLSFYNPHNFLCNLIYRFLPVYTMCFAAIRLDSERTKIRFNFISSFPIRLDNKTNEASASGKGISKKESFTGVIKRWNSFFLVFICIITLSPTKSDDGIHRLFQDSPHRIELIGFLILIPPPDPFQQVPPLSLFIRIIRFSIKTTALFIQIDKCFPVRFATILRSYFFRHRSVPS